MDYRSLSNSSLLARLRELAVRDRAGVSDFVACLAEADRRAEAILGEGYPSLFEFCVRDLKLAESTAYQRVRAARLARARPEILSLLADGAINLSTLCLIAPLLEERPGLLTEIVGKRKREVEDLVASFGAPREVPDRIRPLAPAVVAKTGGSLFSAEPPPALPAAETSSRPAPAEFELRTEFRFAAGPRFVEAVKRLRGLLWHKHPDGRLEDLLYEAASDFIVRRDPAREPERAARPTVRPARSRRVPAALRRAVWRRDGGRCALSGPAGRCEETRGLELDHVAPWALGGRSDRESNLRLLCRGHNQSEALRLLGPRASLPG